LLRLLGRAVFFPGRGGFAEFAMMAKSAQKWAGNSLPNGTEG
jgi:hypothetical protein